MKFPRFRFGMKSLIALTVVVALLCAGYINTHNRREWQTSILQKFNDKNMELNGLEESGFFLAYPTSHYHQGWLGEELAIVKNMIAGFVVRDSNLDTLCLYTPTEDSNGRLLLASDSIILDLEHLAPLEPRKISYSG